MDTVRNTKRLVREEIVDWRETRCLSNVCWLQRQCSGSWLHEKSNIAVSAGRQYNIVVADIFWQLRCRKNCALFALFWRKEHLQQQQINITSNDNDDHVNNNEHTWIT